MSFTEIELEVIQAVRSAKKPTQVQKDFLELLGLETRGEQEDRIFKIMLSSLVDIEKAERRKREAKAKISEARRIRTAESRKERTRKLIEAGADLVRLGVLSPEGDFLVDKEVFIGLLVQYPHLYTDPSHEVYGTLKEAGRAFLAGEK